MDESDKRCHYTEREKLLLAQLVSEEKSISSKKTGIADLRKKADAWERVCKKYCSQGCTPRTVKQLRKCWDNMKQKKRKCNTAIRHSRLMTGGGPAEEEPNDPVFNFIDANDKAVDVEIACPYDSTALYEQEYPNQNENPNKEILIESSLLNTDTEYTDIDINLTPQKNVSCNKNIWSIHNEKQLLLIKLRESIEQQRELHAKKMKIAEMEEKIAIAKLLKEEELLKQAANI